MADEPRPSGARVRFCAVANEERRAVSPPPLPQVAEVAPEPNVASAQLSHRVDPSSTATDKPRASGARVTFCGEAAGEHRAVSPPPQVFDAAPEPDAAPAQPPHGVHPSTTAIDEPRASGARVTFCGEADEERCVVSPPPLQIAEEAPEPAAVSVRQSKHISPRPPKAPKPDVPRRPPLAPRQIEEPAWRGPSTEVCISTPRVAGDVDEEDASEAEPLEYALLDVLRYLPPEKSTAFLRRVGRAKGAPDLREGLCATRQP